MKFIAATLVFTLIPGLLVLNSLGLYPDKFYRFPLALAVGICIDILIFMLFSLLNFKSGLWVLGGVLIICYGLSRQALSDAKLLFNTYKRVSLADCAWFLLASAIIMGLVVKLYYIPNILPGLESVIYYVDYPWHIGNIAEIKNHWFPENPRLTGHPFHYHIFFYIYIALMAYVSKVSIPVIFFRLYILLFFYLLLLGSYYLGSHWHDNKKVGKIYAIMTLFIGTALCSHPANLFLKDLFYSPTFFLALILFMFALNEIKAYLNQQSHGIVILLLLGGLIGAKGSFFPILWGGLAMTIMFNLALKRYSKNLSFLLIGGLIIFIPIFLYIFKTPGGEGLNLVLGEIIYTTNWYSYFTNYIGAASLVVGLSFIPLYLLGFFSFRLWAFINNSVAVITKPHTFSSPDFLLFSIIIISLPPAYLLSYRGNSQYFFLFVGIIALNLVAAGYLYQLFTSKNRKILKTMMAAFLILGILDTGVMVHDTSLINQKLADISRKPLTPGIYAGLSYIKDNTDTAAIIGSYRVFLISEDNPRFFYYSAFAERRVVVEGYMYNPYKYAEEAQNRYQAMQTLFFTRDKNTAINILNKYGIDILIVDKRAKQRLRFDTSGIMHRTFDNEEMEVWELVKA